MITIKDKYGNFHDLSHLIFKGKTFSYVYQGAKIIWSAVSKIWRGRDIWKNNETWKY